MTKGRDDWRHDLEGRFWFELRRPGCTPVRKGSWPISMLKATLKEFMTGNPDAFITVVTIGPEGPMFQDAPEALSVLDLRSRPTSRKHRDSTSKAFAEHHAVQRDVMSTVRLEPRFLQAKP